MEAEELGRKVADSEFPAHLGAWPCPCLCQGLPAPTCVLTPSVFGSPFLPSREVRSDLPKVAQRVGVNTQVSWTPDWWVSIRF